MTGLLFGKRKGMLIETRYAMKRYVTDHNFYSMWQILAQLVNHKPLRKSEKQLFFSHSLTIDILYNRETFYCDIAKCRRICAITGSNPQSLSGNSISTKLSQTNFVWKYTKYQNRFSKFNGSVFFLFEMFNERSQHVELSTP